MSTDQKQRYTTDEDGHRWNADGYPVGALGIRESTWDVVRIIAIMGVFVLVVVGLVTFVGHFRDQAIAERAADLREKYGVTIEVPQGSRTRTPPPWVIDGEKRNCTWGDRGDLTVLCLDGTGVYTEIEKKR